MVNVGGEPFKIAAVAPWLGVRRAAGSVVLYQMLHTFGMLLSFLTAVVLGALFLPSPPAFLPAPRVTLPGPLPPPPLLPPRHPPRPPGPGFEHPHPLPPP